MQREINSAALLKQTPLFAGLGEEQLATLVSRSRRRRFPAHEAIFHQGDPGHTLYVIVSGCVNIQTESATGETIHLAQRRAGEAFGELALADGKPRMADAITAEPTELLMLDREAFVRCVEDSPKIALRVIAYLADRLREAGATLESRQALDVRGRLAEKLLALADTHGTRLDSGGIRIDLRVTQQEIAERIGTTRESVNRELARLRTVKAIRMDGRAIVVTDPAKLKQYVEQ